MNIKKINRQFIIKKYMDQDQLRNKRKLLRSHNQ